jgi:ATPase involved in DNA replication initiation
VSAAAQGALPLGYPRRRAMGRTDFVVSPANAEAAALIAAPAAWPGGRLALYGPEGAGKTHLARVFMAEDGAALTEAYLLRPADWPVLKFATHGVPRGSLTPCPTRVTPRR